MLRPSRAPPAPDDDHHALAHVLRLEEQVVSLRADIEVEAESSARLARRNEELEREVLSLQHQLATIAQGNAMQLDSAVDAVLEDDVRKFRRSAQRMRRQLEQYEVDRQVSESTLSRLRADLQAARSERDAAQKEAKRAHRLYRDKKEALERVERRPPEPPPPPPPRPPPKPKLELRPRPDPRTKQDLEVALARCASLDAARAAAEDRAAKFERLVEIERHKVRGLDAARATQRKALHDLVADVEAKRKRDDTRLAELRHEADTYKALLEDAHRALIDRDERDAAARRDACEEDDGDASPAFITAACAVLERKLTQAKLELQAKDRQIQALRAQLDDDPVLGGEDLGR